MIHGGTDKTYMEAIVPRVKFIEPMGYEMSAKLIEGYAQIILEFEKDRVHGKHMRRK